MIDPFDAAGPLRQAYREVDWAANPLGPVPSWSPALRGAVDTMLHTRHAVTLMWGPEFVLLYNAAYVPMIGGKHPAALGASAREVFAEIWDGIGPMLESVRAGGGATWTENMKLLMNRHGFPEETYFTFSYSAVRGADGGIEGVIDIAAETTAQVIGRRRLELLSGLTERLADVETVPELVERALPVLASDPDDLPGVGIVDGDGAGDPRVRIPLAGGLFLATGRSPHLPDDEEHRGFLRLVAASLDQGLSRVAVRRLAATERQLAEALQRSLLSRPAQPPHLEVAVRYHPAAEGARVGGDWYDAFALPDGRLAVAVGDVGGHDQNAAAAMSQIRNLLRGISYALPEPPARVLAALNETLLGLRVDVLATVVLGQLDLATYELRWSNAGHPPPLLLDPDGGVHVLERPAQPLVGIELPVVRSDHRVRLEPGATLVLYTDGLVERRGRGFDAGLATVRTTLAGRHDLTAEELCDHLAVHFDDNTDDDTVVLVLRRRPD